MAEKLKENKYLIVFLLFLGWLLGNLDRLSINYAIIGITKDFQLDPQQAGYVLSAFFAGYALMQIPGGLLADKIGPKKILVAVITIWSIFTFLTGMAWTLAIMIAVRFIFGVFEAGFIPACSKMLGETFQTNERGKAYSMMLSSGPIAQVIIPLTATALMLAIGWRSIFYGLGVFGILVALLYQFLMKPMPAAPKAAEPTSNENYWESMKELFRMPMMWLLFLASFSIYTITWGVASWIPTYLATARGLDLKTLGFVAVIPAFAGIASMLMTGAIIDRTKKPGRDKNFAAATMLGSAVMLYLMYYTPSLTMYVIYSVILTLFYASAIMVVPGMLLKYLPTNVMATANGMTNTGAQLAGLITPTVIGTLVKISGGSYMASFMYMVAFGVIGAVFFFLIRAKAASAESES